MGHPKSNRGPAERTERHRNMFKKTDVEIPFLEGWIGYVWGRILAPTK